VILAVLPILGLASTAVAPASGEAVSESRAAFYRRAFPEARRFVVRRVPEEAVPTEDRGNETYVEVRDESDTLVGYLRDFSGPLSATPACPCHPLSVTLAFDASLRFRTLIAETPLEKYGHAPMTDEEMRRLVEIVRDPPPALLKAPRPEDVVDAITGATRTEYREMVVHQAALTTRRVAGLAQDTPRLIRGAPLSRDRQAFAAVLAAERDPASLATRLAAFLPQTETPEALAQAYDAMAFYYAQALKRGDERQAVVEKRLLEAEAERPGSLAKACHDLAQQAVGLAFVQECIRRLTPRAAAIDAASWALLTGTEAFESGRVAQAVAPLRSAADVVAPIADPALHLRLVQSLSATGHKEEGCGRAKALFRDAPRFPGAETWLSLCPEPGDALAEALREERHRALLEEERGEGSALPRLPLFDESDRSAELDVGRVGLTHVLIFFAAWCPHCQAAFPQFREAAGAIQADAALQQRVRVMGVRTYTERDVEPWPDFARRFSPNFTVWRDAPDGSSLRMVAAAFGLPASVPRLLVVDGRGNVRFVIEADPYREIARELLWAVEAVAKPDRR
jgi:thiol-disulfide isomerase/thioredoxin